MSDAITFGAFVAGIWAFSLASLRAVRNSEYAEQRLRDAAAAAIVALNIVAGAAAAAAAGLAVANSWGMALLAIFIFFIPFIAMAVIYRRGGRAAPLEPPTGSGEAEDSENPVSASAEAVDASAAATVNRSS